MERVNGRLQAEGVPEVEMIILKWRVSQLLRDIQRKYSTCERPRFCMRAIAHPQMYVSLLERLLTNDA